MEEQTRRPRWRADPMTRGELPQKGKIEDPGARGRAENSQDRENGEEAGQSIEGGNSAVTGRFKAFPLGKGKAGDTETWRGEISPRPSYK